MRRTRREVGVDAIVRELSASMRSYADSITEAERALARFTDAAINVRREELRMRSAFQATEGMLHRLRHRHDALADRTRPVVAEPLPHRMIRIRPEEPER